MTRRRRRVSSVRWVVVLALLLCAGGARASGDHDHGERHDTHGDEEHGHEAESHVFSVEDFVAHGVRLATAGPGAVDAGIELPAEVRPNADRLAHVAARFPGIVREVRAQIGDSVRRGDVLARIESDNLAIYELRAAFDGTVIDKHVSPGETVTRENALFVVADLSSVWVTLQVYQRAIPMLHVGQSVVVSTRDGSLEAEGTLSYLSPVVDEATRAATARVVLPNPDGRWRPGLFVVATVSRSVDAAVVVPRRALHTVGGETVVFVVERDRFAARPVSVGEVGRTMAAITAGLVSGERVADDGSFLVKAELGKGEAEHHH